MSTQELLKQHGWATLAPLSMNTNGTMWLCSDGNRCNSGVDYKVLVAGVTMQDIHCNVYLNTLHDIGDILEVSVDGVIVY